MKGIFGLAGPFLDRVANPAYGVAENEAHAARFAELLARDPELREQLNGIELDGEDLDLLSTHSWLWFLAWKRAERSKPPTDRFLDRLFDHTADAVVRMKVVEAAATDPGVVSQFSERRSWESLQELPRFWLRRRLLSVVGKEEPERLDRREEWERPPKEPGEPVADASAQALEMTMLMLQVGNEVTLGTTRTFLRHRWEHQERLVSSAEEALRRALVGDEEGLASWRRRIGLTGLE